MQSLHTKGDENVQAVPSDYSKLNYFQMKLRVRFLKVIGIGILETV